MNKRYGAGGAKARAEQVQVRLVPAIVGHPVQVKLSTDEKAALLAAAAEHTHEGQLSSFLRDIAVEAASHLHARALVEAPADKVSQWVVEMAASECSMLPGEFMRFVALEAIGYTHGLEVATRARAAIEDKVLLADKDSVV
jgi:uncharacterized protein (DUF1778 family)